MNLSYGLPHTKLLLKPGQPLNSKHIRQGFAPRDSKYERVGKPHEPDLLYSGYNILFSYNAAYFRESPEIIYACLSNFCASFCGCLYVPRQPFAWKPAPSQYHIEPCNIYSAGFRALKRNFLLPDYSLRFGICSEIRVHLLHTDKIVFRRVSLNEHSRASEIRQYAAHVHILDIGHMHIRAVNNIPCV